MDFVCNLPFFCIVLSLATGVISSVLKPKAAKAVSIILVSISCVFTHACMNAWICKSAVLLQKHHLINNGVCFVAVSVVS